MQAVLILVYLPLSYAGNHILQRHFTAMPGIKDFPEYIETHMVDGEIITYYDSITQRNVPVLKCMKDHLDPPFWNTSTMVSKDEQEFFMILTESIKQRFKQTGVHVLQGIHGCCLEESGATDRYSQEGYDGEDYQHELSGKDVSDINGAEPAGKEPNCIHCLQICIKNLKMYLQHGKGCLGRKVPPEVSVFLGNSSSVVCHATGFYPKAVNMTWKRDGEEMQEDVDVGETLPNGDGTYQKRAVLTVSPEERERSLYTCEVELIIRTLPEPGRPLGLIIGIVLAISAAIAILVVVCRYRGQRSSTSQGGTGSTRLTWYGSFVLCQRGWRTTKPSTKSTSGDSSNHPGGCS